MSLKDRQGDIIAVLENKFSERQGDIWEGPDSHLSNLPESRISNLKLYLTYFKAQCCVLTKFRRDNNVNSLTSDDTWTGLFAWFCSCLWEGIVVQPAFLFSGIMDLAKLPE